MIFWLMGNRSFKACRGAGSPQPMGCAPENVAVFFQGSFPPSMNYTYLAYFRS